MNRIEELRKVLSQYNIDALFVKSESNITYLSGFTGGSSRLIISSDDAVLITDGRYLEQALKECSEDISVVSWLNDERYSHKTYGHVLRNLCAINLGFQSNELTFSEYTELNKLERIELNPLSGIVEPLRQIKSVEEIKKLRTACEISDKALNDTLKIINPGISELELTAELEYNLKINGAENISFDTIVLFGERTSLLHGKPSGRKLEAGDIILFDFGALYQGYHADISRVMMCAKANSKQREMYNIVDKIGINAMNELKSGISAKTIATKTFELIPKEYQKFFYPGMGHGVGLQIHENPFIKYDSEDMILKNMVLTIEPGLYIPGWGGMRIEDTVLITENSCEPLNQFDRRLLEL